MMSGVPLETCWAFNKLWNNKFYYKLHLVGISTELKSLFIFLGGNFAQCIFPRRLHSSFGEISKFEVRESLESEQDKVMCTDVFGVGKANKHEKEAGTSRRLYFKRNLSVIGRSLMNITSITWPEGFSASLKARSFPFTTTKQLIWYDMIYDTIWYMIWYIC
jgi:hypothetical protein